ncbi:MAG: cation-translocating P-type ATPase [Bacteroidota bacterium]
MGKDRVELTVDGMTCSNCAASLQRFLERKGLEQVYVNFQTKEVRFEEGKQGLDIEIIKRGIHKLGFQVVEADTPEPWWTLERKLWISAAFMLPLFVHHLLMMVGVPIPVLDNPWVQLLICTPPFIIGFLHFGQSGWTSLKGGVPNMDVLIVIGGTAAFTYSLIGTLVGQMDYIFYETAATIFTLVLAGNWMEKRAVEQTTTAIGELSRLQVEKAKLILPAGGVVTVDRSALKIGQAVQVNEGDQIPGDGIILKGEAAVDESMLTGESLPLEKAVGAHVIGGSLLVQGNIQVELTATGKDTVLSQMIELVKTAQEDKPAIQRLADRISAIFVPVVLSISLLTLGFGYGVFGLSFQQALMNAIAVLVISCPCAMGLATPTAVMVGVGRLAKNGILVKGGQTLETFANIRHFIFDKTGTLTTGAFKVDHIDYFEEDHARIHALIIQLEQHSSHPIAQSLVKHFRRKPTQLNGLELQVEEKKGFGMLAEDSDGNHYALGAPRILQNKSDLSDAYHVVLAKNGTLLAGMRLTDAVKPDAAATIAYLKKVGGTPVILSGDKAQRVAEVADALGIETYYGEQLPHQKLEKIAEKQQSGLTAMIGDGINDAPAMAKANLGISLSNASQVAIESAELVLLKDKLSKLVDAHQISKHTVLTIKQNLFWAFAYNVVAIPIAAMGFLNPMWGALFMAFSDVVVIGNSIRLKYKKVD